MATAAKTIATKYVGRPMKRKEDPRLITGSSRYVDDVRLPEMHHAAFVRSPHAHAKINSIDVSKALAAPGVVAVLTGEDEGCARAGTLRN